MVVSSVVSSSIRIAVLSVAHEWWFYLHLPIGSLDDLVHQLVAAVVGHMFGRNCGSVRAWRYPQTCLQVLIPWVFVGVVWHVLNSWLVESNHTLIFVGG